MNELYGMPESFFDEIDSSVKRNCRKVNDMQTYLMQFQGFSQELMMLMGNLLNWKFRLPSFLKGVLRNLTAKAVARYLRQEQLERRCGAQVRFGRASVQSEVGLLRNLDDRIRLQCPDSCQERA